MELKFVSDQAYTHLMSTLEEIKEYLKDQKRKSPLDDLWLDIQEVCMLLKISKRTLQYYRDRKILPFSQISGKIYFKASDIQKHLEDNYHK